MFYQNAFYLIEKILKYDILCCFCMYMILEKEFFVVNKILKDCLCNVVNRLNVF